MKRSCSILAYLILSAASFSASLAQAQPAGQLGQGEPRVTLSSGADQVFDFFDSPALAALTIFAEAPEGAITDGGIIRLCVPEDWACSFITTNSVTLSGNAAGKIGTPVYADGGRTLELPVIEDFEDDDAVVIAGLQLDELLLLPPGTKALELDFDGDGQTDCYDDYSITVQAIWSGGGFDGWDTEAAPTSEELGSLRGIMISFH